MNYGLGALVDDYDARDRRYLAQDIVGSTMVKSQSMGPLDHVYTHPRLGWLNQTVTEACVGYGVCQTVYTYLHSLGMDEPMGSPLATYFHACARAVGWDNVTDDGSKPRNAWESLREFGLVPFEKWPRSRNVNTWNDVAKFAAKQPDPDCYRESIDINWLRYHWIQSFGAERAFEVKQTLSAGRPFGLTLTLDESFQDWQIKDGAWRRRYPVKGYHYVCAVGYESTGLWIANSWGSGFGQLGYALISWDTLMSAETRSLAVPEVNMERM